MHGGRRAGCSGRSVPPRTSQSLSEGRSPTACKVNLGITLGIGQLKKYIYICIKNTCSCAGSCTPHPAFLQSCAPAVFVFCLCLVLYYGHIRAKFLFPHGGIEEIYSQLPASLLGT